MFFSRSTTYLLLAFFVQIFELYPQIAQELSSCAIDCIGNSNEGQQSCKSLDYGSPERWECHYKGLLLSNAINLCIALCPTQASVLTAWMRQDCGISNFSPTPLNVSASNTLVWSRPVPTRIQTSIASTFTPAPTHTAIPDETDEWSIGAKAGIATGSSLALIILICIVAGLTMGYRGLGRSGSSKWRRMLIRRRLRKFKVPHPPFPELGPTLPHEMPANEQPELWVLGELKPGMDETVSRENISIVRL